jgi:hypothetical protein
VAQDLSNYWFPKLYFQDPKTKLFEPVANGGLLVYYQNRGDADKRNGGPGLKVQCLVSFHVAFVLALIIDRHRFSRLV